MKDLLCFGGWRSIWTSWSSLQENEMTVLSCENDGTSVYQTAGRRSQGFGRRLQGFGRRSCGFDPVHSVFQGTKSQVGMHPLEHGCVQQELFSMKIAPAQLGDQVQHRHWALRRLWGRRSLFILQQNTLCTVLPPQKKSEQTIWELAILIHPFDKEKKKKIDLDILRQKTQIYFLFFGLNKVSSLENVLAETSTATSFSFFLFLNLKVLPG